MLCLAIAVVGVVTVARMPVDLFPDIKIPVVMCATFYQGMPPEQIETHITDPFERIFTLGSNINYIESRSLTGVSLIRVFFQPGSDPNADVTEVSNLAMAELRRLPPGTLPPVVLPFTASSMPVCFVTLRGAGLNQMRLHDLGQYIVREELANVKGASVPPPFGGKYRQIQVYVNPLKLEAHDLSPIDVMNAVNNSNQILPSGDVRIGPYDYNLYADSQMPTMQDIDNVPLRTIGNNQLLVSDVGYAKDGAAIQYNMVLVNGHRSVYLPILKQGGASNTIDVVDGIRHDLKHLFDVPKTLKARVIFDQSVFVKTAIANLGSEGSIGLFLTAMMILIFLGNPRATAAVMLTIPLSALAALMVLNLMGDDINTMVLGGLALAFSRLIDNSVVVLENIFRHLEMGEPIDQAAEVGGAEMALPVLAATFTTAIVFFPVVFLYGVSKYLFTAMALAVGLSLFASYAVAMTVVPLFCALFIRNFHHDDGTQKTYNPYRLFLRWFNRSYERTLEHYDVAVRKSLRVPWTTVGIIMGAFVLSLALFPKLGTGFFPSTYAGQFVINVKTPVGSRLRVSEAYIKRLLNVVHEVIPKKDLKMTVANIGLSDGFESMYTTNSDDSTAFVDVSLKKHHSKSTGTYIKLLRNKIDSKLPELSTFITSGSLISATVNQGMPAPLDVQVEGMNLNADYNTALKLAARIRKLSDVSAVLIPQDMDYPALKVQINRPMTARMGLNSNEVVSDVITGLDSNGMIAPSYWVAPNSGNNYIEAVQFPIQDTTTLNDLKELPLRSANGKQVTTLAAVTKISYENSPSEVTHYQLIRVIDVYVSPKGQNLGLLARNVQHIIKTTKVSSNERVTMRGSVNAMNKSLLAFGIGLIMSVVLVYLILMAQFASFIDPFIILLAVPPGLMGVILILLLSHTTLDVMSLMGVIMMTGIVVSNSILIIDATRVQLSHGLPVAEAVSRACRIRLRPILMTAFATILGMLPMAFTLEEGSQFYAPLARAVIGGLLVSVVLTMFIVPAAYLIVYRNRGQKAQGVNG
jgi:multidrug efflux pump subunit AcrB